MKNSFKDLTFAELITKLGELEKDYFDFRLEVAVGHVSNPLKKRNLRRQIARLNTLIYNHPDVSVGTARS